MKALILALLTALSVTGCKPQDPAPLPPQVGTRSTPAPEPATAAPTSESGPADAAAPVAADAPAVPADAAGTVAVDGASVYQKACVTCHGTGLAGAPRLGDAADWGPRIAQGEAVMFDHAIKGFTGKKGMMPPKGGFMQLSDDEIRAAIGYMSTAPAP